MTFAWGGFQAVGLVAILGSQLGCGGERGCLGGDDGACVPESACGSVSWECGESRLKAVVLADATLRPPGLDALAARGDLVLSNDRIRAVFDGLQEPHYLAPTGGALLDLAPMVEGAGDDINLVFQAVGILPDDAVAYESVELVDERPRAVAAVYRGHLDGRRRVEVVTRYEVRACDPGVRIRTDVYHGGSDPMTVFLSDAFFWGDRELSPFVPVTGRGYGHPDLDLEKIGDAFTKTPFMAAGSQSDLPSAYAAISCEGEPLDGFHDPTLSAIGPSPRVLMPGDSIGFQRFVMVAPGPGISRATDLALEVRRELRGDDFVTLSGRTVSTSGSPIGGDVRRVSLLVSEDGGQGEASSRSVPWSDVVPSDDGHFSVRVPADAEYSVEPRALGHALADGTRVEVGGEDRDVGDIVLPEPGAVSVTVRLDGKPTIAEVVVVPEAACLSKSGTAASAADDGPCDVDAESRCVPSLGPAHGGSPACNRVLADGSGQATFVAPDGGYCVYATHGPFTTLARDRVEVRSGSTAPVALDLTSLDLLPDGVLSADFHVHGGASFDSSLPDIDRAMTFVASDVQVVAATDHEVVSTYADVVEATGIGDRIQVMPGVESTGHILFLRPPGADVPRVIGHFNFWPLHHDRNAPRNGFPDDQRIEPGQIFDRMRPLYDGVGVAQMNHPLGDASLGRDIGYLRAIDYDPRIAVPDHDDGSGNGQLRRHAPGGSENIAFDTQEVMNGSSLRQFLLYRTSWHAFLNQGILRAGTANSDSHTHAIEVLGYPRNLVFGGHSLAAFDRDRFNQDVKAGHLVGTNGPVLVICVEAADGQCQGPSLAPFAPSPGAKVRVEVKAAPWIPIDEIRFVVEGRVVRTITTLDHPADPLSAAGVVRYSGAVALADLMETVPAGRDTWLVVEAGLPLPRTVDDDDDGFADERDADGACVDRRKRPPADAPRYHMDVVAPGTWPSAFSNPFLLDRDGGGWTAPGLGR